MGIAPTPKVKTPVNSTHSAAKPLNGGRAESISAPKSQSRAVIGIFEASPLIITKRLIILL